MSDWASRVTSGRTGRSSMETRRSVGSARDGRLEDEQESEMSLWTEHELTDKVVEVLAVHCNNEVHHFGRPFITASARDRDAVAVPGHRRSDRQADGGAGVGQHNSLARYLPNELSKQIKAQCEAYPVEGALFSN